MSLRHIGGFLSNFYNPLEVPDIPTDVSATAGNAQADVSFTAPSNPGGSAISGYTVISDPGSITATGSSSPISVTGLTNDTSYTFRMWAINTYGPSATTDPTGSVTPSLPKFFADLASNAAASKVVVDDDLNIYVYGMYTTNNYAQLAKYNSAGVLQWQRQLNQIANDGMNGFTLDSSGNIIFTGSGFSNGYLYAYKISSSGSIVWQKYFGPYAGGCTVPVVYDASAICDSSDNVYINGEVDTIDEHCFYLIKVTSSGTISWNRRSQAGYVFGRQGFPASAIDSSGNVYCAQSYNYGSYPKAYLAKYNSSGTRQWAYRIIPTGYTYSWFSGCVVDSSDNVYATGTFTSSNQVMIVKRNSSGTLQWARYLSNGILYNRGCAIDSNDNIYVCGYNSSDYSMFLVKYNSSGVIQWQRKFYSASRKFFTGNVYVGSDDLPVVCSRTTNNCNANYKFFIAKVPPDGSLTGTYTVGGDSYTYGTNNLADNNMSSYDEGSVGGTDVSVTLNAYNNNLTLSTSSLTASVTYL